MDAYELMSVVRSYSRLQSENDLGTLMLLRYLNMANKAVSQMLLPIYRQYLIKTTTQLSQNGTEVSVPGDVLQLIAVERELTAASDNFKPASPVDIANKVIINKNPDFVPTADFPLYTDEGRKINLYPTMTTLDVRLTYRKRIADLIYGKVATIAVGGATVTLNTGAYPSDDYYNDYFLALYQVSSGVHSLNNIHLITDYVASSKITTISPVTALTSANEVYYALVPILPEEFQDLLVDGTLIELKKAGKIGADVPVNEEGLRARINTLLGVDVAVKEEQ